MCADGQSDGVLCFLGEIEIPSMPSAICMTYSREGFVVAADGRARENGEVVSEKTKKVFQAGDLPLAYAMCGRTSFDTKTTKNAVDLLKEAPYGIIGLSKSRHADLSSYAVGFGMHLYTTLKKAQDAGDLEPLPTKQTDLYGRDYHFLHVFLAGYYLGQADWKILSLRHRDQFLLEPKVHDIALRKKPYVYGSAKIEKLLFDDDDPALCLYRVKGFHESEHPSLSDGIEALKSYIRACCDPEIAEFDPNICAAIGGRIHVATITPKEGFSWVCPPEQQ